MQSDIEKIISKSNNPKLIADAFEFASKAYEGKSRLSGENYIFHATRVASTLDKMNLDSTTIAFGLLHDVLDDIPISGRKSEIKDLENKFGKEIAGLVEKISELAKIRYSLDVGIKSKKKFTKEKIENLRRMFLALSGDIRVVLLELISRLDGLDFLHYLPEDHQKLYALETLQIFVPIAGRLGMSEIRRKLEDMAFSYLFPNKYKWVKENVKEQYEEREKYLKKFIPHLQKIFRKERIVVLDMNYRAKSYWSTYQKLLKHDMDFNRIHDLLALRIITKDVESCYRILGIVHKHFKPIHQEINDYIAHPKLNGYRSLHTTIFSSSPEFFKNYEISNAQNAPPQKNKLTEGGKITEIQIRTEEMQKESEFGICAHWSYKEKINLKKDGRDFKWLEEAPDFWKTFKLDFFPDKVFCFTPKGDVIVLPKNSTPIDFAYTVHSDIGNHCETAKIGNKIVPLNHLLENVDIVYITVNKNKNPSKDWLSFVKSSLAKSHIKKATAKEQSKFSFLLPGFVRRKFAEISEAAQKKKEEKKLVEAGAARHIFLAGQKGMLIHIAKCCNPQPGDEINAYLAPNRATVLHKTSCSVFKKIVEKFPEKIVDASW